MWLSRRRRSIRYAARFESGMHLVIPVMGPTPRTAPKVRAAAAVGFLATSIMERRHPKSCSKPRTFLDCSPGGEFHACLVLQSSCTGTTFDEVMRDFELQRDKNFTLHDCSDHPSAKSKDSWWNQRAPKARRRDRGA